MGKAGRKTKTFALGEKRLPQIHGPNCSPPAWNYKMKDLGAVIFFCSNETMDECHSNLLFGLPAIHFSYVKNVEPGLPLFLFNHSDRSLHGVYEAAGHGRMNIDPFGWTGDGSDRTPYPAQVRIRVRKQCQPLSEKKFREVIHKNYIDHEDRKAFFRLELDRKQTRELISLFECSPVTKSIATLRKASRSKPPQIVDPDLDKLATKEASCEHVNMELNFPSDPPQSSGSWASLFKKHSDPVPKIVGEDVKKLVSEADVYEEDPVCEDMSFTDSGTSGWDEEKQVVGVDLSNVRTENEEHMYSNPQDQLTSVRVNSSMDKKTEDRAPCYMDRATIGDEEDIDVLQMTFERVYSTLDEHAEFVPCKTYGTTIVDQLKKEVEDWKAFSMEQHQKTSSLEKKLMILETYAMEQDRRTGALEKKLAAMEKEQVILKNQTAMLTRSERDLTEPEDTEDW